MVWYTWYVWYVWYTWYIWYDIPDMGNPYPFDTSHLVNRGYKATLLLVARVPLWLGGSTLHQGRRFQFVEKPDIKGYLPITLPLIFVLQTMTQFHEQLCQLLGPLSDGFYRQRCHSLSQMYVIWQTFTLTTCYLESSPLLSGCPR